MADWLACYYLGVWHELHALLHCDQRLVRAAWRSIANALVVVAHTDVRCLSLTQLYIVELVIEHRNIRVLFYFVSIVGLIIAIVVRRCGEMFVSDIGSVDLT